MKLSDGSSFVDVFERLPMSGRLVMGLLSDGSRLTVKCVRTPIGADNGKKKEARAVWHFLDGKTGYAGAEIKNEVSVVAWRDLRFDERPERYDDLCRMGTYV
jgi:hypothetical protein